MEGLNERLTGYPPPVANKPQIQIGRRKLIMALTFDPSKAEGTFTLLPEGEYEVFISEVDHTYAQTSGNEMLVVNYTVRDDVEQEGQGQKIRFDRFTNAEAAHWRFHALNKALKVEPGFTVEDFKEWRDFIKGKAVKVVVKHVEATFGKNAGKVFPEVKGFKESEVGGELHFTKVDNDPFNQGSGQIDIKDDDLPF
jgi:Protein of unknown function (DUF669)